MGGGFPLPNRLEGLGSVVNIPETPSWLERGKPPLFDALVSQRLRRLGLGASNPLPHINLRPAVPSRSAPVTLRRTRSVWRCMCDHSSVYYFGTEPATYHPSVVKATSYHVMDLGLPELILFCISYRKCNCFLHGVHAQ